MADDRRVVGAWTRNRIAPPPCNVRFRCPTCFGEVVKDAYDGPVSHEACNAFMVPVSVVVSGDVPERFPIPTVVMSARGIE